MKNVKKVLISVSVAMAILLNAPAIIKAQPLTGQEIAEIQQIERNIVNHVNQATRAELEEIVGIGEKRAEHIMGHIEKNGPIQNMEQLEEVNGIGHKTAQRVEEAFRTE